MYSALVTGSPIESDLVVSKPPRSYLVSETGTTLLSHQTPELPRHTRITEENAPAFSSGTLVKATEVNVSSLLLRASDFQE